MLYYLILGLSPIISTGIVPEFYKKKYFTLQNIQGYVIFKLY